MYRPLCRCTNADLEAIAAREPGRLGDVVHELGFRRSARARRLLQRLAPQQVQMQTAVAQEGTTGQHWCCDRCETLNALDATACCVCEQTRPASIAPVAAPVVQAPMPRPQPSRPAPAPVDRQHITDADIRNVIGKRIRIIYGDKHGTITKREVIPRSMTSYGMHSAFVAHCFMARAERHFLVSRVQHLELIAGGDAVGAQTGGPGRTPSSAPSSPSAPSPATPATRSGCMLWLVVGGLLVGAFGEIIRQGALAVLG